MEVKTNEILYLNEREIESLVPMDKAITLVEKSFVEYANGDAVNPIKLHLPIYPDYDGYINSMPAYLSRLKIAGAKIVSVYHDNMKNFSLPTTMGTILLHQVESGKLLSLMGGTYITSARTGAVCAVMAKYTAKSSASSLTVIGSGAQGLSASMQIMTVLPMIAEVRVYDINPEAQDRFIAKCSEKFPDVNYIKYDDLQDSVTGSDIILSAAPADKPILIDLEYTKGSTLIVLEGDFGASFAKKFNHFVGDFRECLVERFNSDALHHAEKSGITPELLTDESVTEEIGDIIVGKAKGRANDEETILCANVGMGIQDIIVANEAYQEAIKLGIGTVLEL